MTHLAWQEKRIAELEAKYRELWCAVWSCPLDEFLVGEGCSHEETVTEAKQNAGDSIRNERLEAENQRLQAEVQRLRELLTESRSWMEESRFGYGYTASNLRRRIEEALKAEGREGE